MTGVSFYGDIDVKGYVKASNGKLLGVVSSMPTAAQKLSGCAVLFTGTSDAYTTGAVYECVSSGNGYAWNRVDAVTAVDDALSATSTNPVQNKAVKAALDGKASTATATTGSAGLMSAADKTKLDGITGGLESLTAEQKAVLANESLQSGYFIDGGAFNTTKMELLMHPADGSSVSIVAKPGNNVTFTRNGADNISINAVVPDISGKADSSALVAFQETVASTYAKDADISKVGKSGKYSDLDGTPTIPSVGNATITIQKNGSAVGTFTTNQSTAGSINITVPTNTTELTNGSGYITKAVSDLTNYYTKSSTYSKSEIDTLVAAKLTITTVDSLPTTSISSSTIYLVKASTTGTQNIYDEYVWTGAAWEKIGTTETDLSQYIKKGTLATVADTGSYNDLSNKPTIPTVPTAVSAFDNDKGYLTAHPGITMGTDTTSTASPSHGGTFTAIDSITKDANGHVTKVNTKTITLPSDSNTDTKMTQAYGTGNAEYPLLMTATSGVTSTGSRGDTTAIVNNQIHANPSTGKITAAGFVGPLSGNATSATTATSATSATTAGSLATARSLKVNLASGNAASFNGSADVTGIGVSGTLPVANGGTGATSLSSVTVGAATTATKLATARTVQTNLASTSTASFDGSANITPGVTGVLPVANGGTGASSLSSITVGAATKATQDGSGNVITSTYATNATVNAIKPIALASLSVTWASDSSYTDFPYKGTITVSGCTANHIPSVTFDVSDATSGDYAPVSESGSGVVYIWSKKNTLTTVPAVVCIPKSS